MANVIEIAKASITAYNDKNWSKAKDTLAADAVYDEKGTHRRIQGAGEIVEAWWGWAEAIPDSKATFVREMASADTAVLELVWRGRPHGTAKDANGRHSGVEQTDRGTGMLRRPGRRGKDQETLALLRHAHAAHTDRRCEGLAS
jgi:SnoaL-like polyketide cyclase